MAKYLQPTYSEARKHVGDKVKSNNQYIKLHERDILTLKIINKQLQKRINNNNAKIEQLRKYNRELKGRN